MAGTTKHPSLEILRLRGIERSVADELLACPEGLAQKTLVERLGGSQATMSRVLSGMKNRGMVVKTGTTKAARFGLSEEARYWSTPASLRKRVDFDPERILSYEPNETRWLTDEARNIFSRSVKKAHAEASEYRKKIMERFLIDLSFASSRMEGNTYSQLDTEVLIKYGQEAEGRSLDEARMILNHKYAISALMDLAEDDSVALEDVCSIHGYLMRSLLDPSCTGSVRPSGVLIGSSAYRPCDDPSQIKQQLGALTWKASRVEDPYESSFLLLAGISYLQVFQDGNKRLGRLLANWPLLRAGLPPLSFVGVDKRDYTQGMLEFYELNDTRLLGETLAKGYAKTVPAYTLASKDVVPVASVMKCAKENLHSLRKTCRSDDSEKNEKHEKSEKSGSAEEKEAPAARGVSVSRGAGKGPRV